MCHPPEDELHNVTLYRLLRTFERAIARFGQRQQRPTHTIYASARTVPAQQEYLRRAAGVPGRRRPFAEITGAFVADRLGVVFPFIALLKLLQPGELRLGEDDGAAGRNAFWVEGAAM